MSFLRLRYFNSDIELTKSLSHQVWFGVPLVLTYVGIRQCLSPYRGRL